MYLLPDDEESLNVNGSKYRRLTYPSFIIVEIEGTVTMKLQRDEAQNASTCPHCGATVLNVQGISACQYCNWSAR